MNQAIHSQSTIKRLPPIAFLKQTIPLLEKTNNRFDNQVQGKRGTREPNKEEFFVDTVRFAVLGLNHGSKIARFAKENPEVELAAVAGFGNSDFQIANELGVPLFSDYTLLFKQIPLDAVYIALPNTLHVEAVENAIEAGIKNILLEKPIANTVEEESM